MIVKYYCRTCGRLTNHGEIAKEHSMPELNFSTLQCLACDTGSFSVQYPKEETSASTDSRRVTDVCGNEEQNDSLC